MATYLPISELSPFSQAWTICGRVIGRAALRSFGKGNKIFTVDVLDAAGSEIRVNFFNAAAEGLDPVLQRGKCFTFGGRGLVRAANAKYNPTNHKYEIVYDKYWEIQEVPDIEQIQTHKFKVTDIASLPSKERPCKVDLLGVVLQAFPALEVSTKAGEVFKRELIVADQSGCSINISLWAAKAQIEDQAFANYPVVGLKCVSLKSWNDNLFGSVMPEGDLVFRPPIVEAVQVQKWWTQNDGPKKSFKSLSHHGLHNPTGSVQTHRVMSLLELREEVPKVKQMQVFVIFCRLHLVQTRRQGELQPLFFDACKEGKTGFVCNRRVDSNGFCAACNRVTSSQVRMNLRCHFSDATDSNWVGVFNEACESIMGFSADDASAQTKAPGGRDALEASIAKRYYYQPLQIMVRARMDQFNGENRWSVGVFDACPVDPSERGRELLAEIHQMLED